MMIRVVFTASCDTERAPNSASSRVFHADDDESWVTRALARAMRPSCVGARVRYAPAR
jgi:hypothetical protein